MFVGIEYEGAGRGVVHNGDLHPAGGLDCWGLLRFVMLKRFGREIPSYAAWGWEDEHQAKLLAREMTQELTACGLWKPVWVKPEPNAMLPREVETRPGDCLLMRVDGVPVHVGVIAERPWFLHTERAQCSCVDDMDGMRWQRRVLGVYRFNDASKLETS
jgi:cell wall-associated NlpC family hydrolase